MTEEEHIDRLSRAWRQCKQADWWDEATHGPLIRERAAYGRGISDGIALAVSIVAGAPDVIVLRDAILFGDGIARSRLAATRDEA